MNADTVSNVLKLWNICSQDEGNSDGLNWESVRDIIRTQNNDEDVEAILQGDFGLALGVPHVNFMRFWHGMENILIDKGAWDIRVLPQRTQKLVQSLQSFRMSVLEAVSRRGGGGAPFSLSMEEVRRLCERRRREAMGQDTGSACVVEYWEDKLQQIATGNVEVTEDEISVAIQQWLEELIEDADELDQPGYVGHSPATGSTMRAEPLEWLWADEEYETDPEVAGFRERLSELLSFYPSGHDLRFAQFYNALRDVLEDDDRYQHRRAALKAGVGVLAGLVAKQLRPAFRTWQERPLRKAPSTSLSMSLSMSLSRRRQASFGPPDRRGGGAAAAVATSGASKAPSLRRLGLRSDSDTGESDQGSSVIAGLIASQAEAAVILERRCSAMPWAYRLGQLLDRARRRSLHSALLRWRPPLSGLALQAQPVASAPPPSRLPGTGTSPMLPPPPRAPSPQNAISASPGARRWGAGRSPGGAQSATPEDHRRARTPQNRAGVSQHVPFRP
mmetsp:Transcript_21107/g.45757  ORF Transcript_21107/g.45757 Transcript_21107/m.45757 type:complete len:503 (-) Transcript_21107:60-1568(-)